jgi:dihydropteroate synthase
MQLLVDVEKHLKEGADWLDIGGFSTRPGAKNVSTQEEIARILPAIKAISNHFPHVPISIDTFRFDVAKAAFEHGAQIINDVSHGRDIDLLTFCAKHNLVYILMHLRGAPDNHLGENCNYQDLLKEVFVELQNKQRALIDLGLKRLIIDPGFGFSKTVAQNFELLKNLDFLNGLNAPLLVGLSRKSMVYKTLNINANEALNGTTALHSIALLKGAKILRVHDVKEAKEVIDLLQTMSV